MSLTTVAEAKDYMGLTSTANDVEIARLVEAADGVVQEMCSQTLVLAEYAETVRASGRELLLSRFPVVSVVSFDGVAVDPEVDYLLNPDIGLILSNGSTGRLRVVYTAGLAVVPAEAVDAALTYVSYRYRRNHGGSESYMPAGVDGSIAPPMGVTALKDQMRLALGPLVRGMRVA